MLKSIETSLDESFSYLGEDTNKNNIEPNR